MRKGMYGRKIEVYTHPKYGGSVPIYLNNIGTFHATFGEDDVTLSAETKSELMKLVDETLKNRTNLEWFPVIEIEFGTNFSFSHRRDEDEKNSKSSEVQLLFERFWIAKKIDKKWIEASWSVTSYHEIHRPKTETGDRLSRSLQFRVSGKYDRNTGREIDLTEFSLPHTIKATDRDEMPKYYVPYTEELWLALNNITNRMEELQKKIIDVLKTPESRANLIANVSKLLPAPKPEPKGKNSGKL